MKKMKNMQKIVCYFLAFIIPVIVMTIVLAMQKAAPFGKASFLYADAYDQYYAMFMEMIRWFESKDHSLFLWDRGMGVDLYTNFLYYNMSVFNVIVLAFGKKNLEISMTIIVILKMACMGLSAGVFFMNTKRYLGEKKDLWFRCFLSLAAALAYCLSNYVLAYNSNLMWLDGMILLPILALGIENMIGKRKWKLYVICLFLTMVSNFYFSVYICLFCLFYFLLQEFENKKRFCREMHKFIFLSVVSALMASVVLFPAFFGISNRGNYDYSMAVAAIPNCGNLISYWESFNFSSSIDGLGGYMFTHNNFCGSLMIFFFLLFLLDKDFTKGYRIRHAIIVLFLVLAANTKFLGYVMHGFSYPHGLSNRFSFILIMLLIIISYEIISKIRELNFKKAAVLLGMIIGLSVLGMLVSPNVSYMLFLFIIFVYGVVILSFSRNRLKMRFFHIWIVGGWIAEMFVNCLLVAPAKVNAVGFRELVNSDALVWEYEKLITDVGERKTSLNNRNVMYASGTNWYSSLLNGNLLDSFQSLGLSNYEAAEVTYRGTTPLSALLYNVRFVLTAEIGMQGGYHVISDTTSIDGMKVYEADLSGGMGFMVSEDILNWKGDKAVSENQNELWENMLKNKPQKALFEEAPLKLVSKKALYMDVVNEEENALEYKSTVPFPPTLYLIYEVQEDADVYFWSDDSKCQVLSANVDGELVASTYYTDTASLIHIGEVKKGQVVGVETMSAAPQGEVGLTRYEMMAFNEDVFGDGIGELLDEVLQVKSIEGNTLAGTIEAKQPGVLYLALPYSDGYQVKVDGKPQETLKIGTGLMGVNIEAGVHDIKVIYQTQGLKAGILLSIVGMMIFVYLVVKDKKSNRENWLENSF